MRRRAFVKNLVLAVGCLLVPAILIAQQWSTSGSDIYSANSGYVGIGTSTPDRKLVVNGQILAQAGIYSGGNVGALYVYDRSTSGISGMYRDSGLTRLWDDTAGDILYYNASGKVGIGTTSPSAKVYIAGGSYGEPGYANQTPYALGAQSLAVDYSIYSYGAICAKNGWGNCEGTGGVVLGTVNADAGINIPATGDTFFNNGSDVGIGTSSPSSRLHVVGDVTVTGNISAKYQDLAEWVPSRLPIPPGAVVVLERGQRNSVIESVTPYDTRVAGVVTEMPGIVLGEAGAGKVKVATTGRVKVRVDATSHPIEVGDLLVTSGKSGTAMRSLPIDLGGVEIHRPGTLIGKALEPLAEGEGEILVLLSLQ